MSNRINLSDNNYTVSVSFNDFKLFVILVFMVIIEYTANEFL